MFIEMEKLYQDIQNDFENGMTKKDLITKYNRSKSVINKILHYGKHPDLIINGLDKDLFLDEYWNNGLEKKEIAFKYGLSDSKMSYVLLKWGIKLSQFDRHKRTKSQMTDNEWNHHIRDHLKGVHKDRWKKRQLSYNDLYQMYVIEGLSFENICKKIKMGESTLFKWIDYYHFLPLSSEDDFIRKKSIGVVYNDKYMGSYNSFLSAKYILDVDFSEIINFDLISTNLEITPVLCSELIIRDLDLLKKCVKLNYFNKPSLYTFFSDKVKHSNDVNFEYRQFQGRLFREHSVINLIRYDIFDINQGFYSSNYEKFIGQYLLKNNIDFTMHNRQLLNGLEIDILLNHLKIGIELNGSLYHSTEGYMYNDSFKSSNYHQNKLINMYNQNYQLIHCYEFEFKYKKSLEILKKKIKCHIQSKLCFDDLIKKQISKQRYLEYVRTYQLWEYYFVKKSEDNLVFYGLFDHNDNIQLAYSEFNNVIKHIAYSFNYSYESLMNQLILLNSNKTIYSNLENGVYQTLIKHTDPCYILLTNHNVLIFNENDQRIKRNKYFKIYNSGYQIINT